MILQYQILYLIVNYRSGPRLQFYSTRYFLCIRLYALLYNITLETDLANHRTFLV